MAERAQTYRRLAGWRIVWLSRLWQVDDHLLLVGSTTVTESYKRFYFRDIQAVIVRRTNTGRILNFVYGGVALFAALIAALLLLISSTSAAADYKNAAIAFGVFFGIIAVFFLMLLVINALLGPTCKTHVRTAVQSRALAPLGRLRTARRVLARIKPVIEAAQSSAQEPAPATVS